MRACFGGKEEGSCAIVWRRASLTHLAFSYKREGEGPLSLFAEGSFIGQYFPGFFFGNRHRNHRHHARTGDAVFHDPEQLAVRPPFVKPAIGKITWPGLRRLPMGPSPNPVSPWHETQMPLPSYRLFPSARISGEAVVVNPKGAISCRARLRSLTGTLGRSGSASFARTRSSA